MANTNVFISFSFAESSSKKKELENILNQSNYAVNYSEKEDRSHQSDETIWKYLKNKISGSSVMVVIYSSDFEKNKGGKAEKVKDNYSNIRTSFKNQGWIYKELRCALRHGANNAMNGIIVVMPDDIYSSKFNTNSKCSKTGEQRCNFDSTGYPDILKNNYINKKSGNWTPTCGCCLNILSDSYIPIIKESEFKKNPRKYIEIVKEKRNHEDEYNIKKEVD